MLDSFKIKTKTRNDLIDITNDLQQIVSKLNIQSGFCVVYVPHTTAGIFINENADPTVPLDISNMLDKIIPWKSDYRHSEGNSAAHIKSIITGSSIQVIIENNKLMLGRWQGVFFAEYDGPRERSVIVKIINC